MELEAGQVTSSQPSCSDTWKISWGYPGQTYIYLGHIYLWGYIGCIMVIYWGMGIPWAYLGDFLWIS